MSSCFQFDNVMKLYSDKILRYGDSPEGLCQGAGNKAVLRYAALAKHIDWQSQDCSILDVGCGFGDFFDFLWKAGWRGRYVGIDITHEAIDIARQKYPQATFNVGDMDTSFPDDAQGVFDYVVGISTFTIKIASKNTDAYYAHCMEKMFHLSKKACLLSGMMSTYVDYQKEMAWHADPAEWYTKAMKLTRSVVLDHSVLPYEFSLVLRHAAIDAANRFIY